MNPESTISDGVQQVPKPQIAAPLALLRSIVKRFPRRAPGSDDERLAQEFIADEIRPHVDEVRLQPFRFSSSLYLVIAAHFAVGLVGTLVFPWSPNLAAVIYAGCGTAYLLDSARWCYTLRHLLPKCDSLNMIAIQRATAPIQRRIVMVGHVDAAPAGLMFRTPAGRVASRRVASWVTELFKPLRLLVAGMFVMAAIPPLKFVWPEVWTFPITFVATNVGAFVLVAGCLQAAFRAPVSPGANDNASGCTAVVALAAKLRDEKPVGTELVYVTTGCEEAGTGGAYELAKAMKDQWDRRLTTIVVLDAVGAGTMTTYREGEVWPQPSDRALVQRADQIAREVYGDPLPKYRAPAGATDQVAFAAWGFRGIAFGTIDGSVGTPANYHQLSDTPENIDEGVLEASIDFAAEFCRNLILETPTAQSPAAAMTKS